MQTLLKVTCRCMHFVIDVYYDTSTFNFYEIKNYNWSLNLIKCKERQLKKTIRKKREKYRQHFVKN